MGSRVVSLRKAQVQQHSLGRSTLLASGGVLTHRNRMFWKQTPHVHRARWAWWRTWVVSHPPHDTFTRHKYHGKHTSKYRELERLNSDSKGARRQRMRCLCRPHRRRTERSLVRDWGRYSSVQFSSKVQSIFFLLRWGWVFLERTRILSGIQFTTHFIEFLVVQTKHFVGSFVNVILTRETCGQHSSRAAESEGRALGNYFSERICYMVPMSKFRGD